MLKLNDKNICTWRRVLATAFNIIMSTTLVKTVLYACTSVVHIPKLIAMVKLFSMLKILKKMLYFLLAKATLKTGIAHFFLPGCALGSKPPYIINM